LHEHIIIYTDGGSRGNPGPAAAAFILTGTDKNIIDGKAFFLGETTNNVAEYTGLVKALSAAKQAGGTSIEVFSDSQLMVRQINGRYKVKSSNLKEFYAECTELLAGFTSWRITHIPRDNNKQADELANRAMDLKKNVTLKTQSGPPGSKPTRLGVLLSGGGRTMVNIQNHIDAGELNAEIVLVVSSRSTVKGIERAEKIGLKPKIIRKKDFDDTESFSNKIFEELKKARVDLVVQAGWLCLWQIPKEYDNKVMNIHPALLPSFGGQGMWGHHVHEAVLKAGCKVSGCTVHFCTNEYDIGPIIVQRSCEVNDDDDADSLAARVFEQECIAYPEAIDLFCGNRLVIEKGIVKRLEHQPLNR
jgi:formyltetrahydrofolate-dependent phosphoribosylglycinamide formyltransferase